VIDGATASETEQGGYTRPSRKVQLAEVSVLLFLVLPQMLLAAFVRDHRGDWTFPLVAVSSITRYLALLVLIFFLLWRNGEPLSSIGWRAAKAAREIALGIALVGPLRLAWTMFAALLSVLGRSERWRVPQLPAPAGWPQFVLAFFYLVVVAVTEETFFRGYLLLRLHAVTGKIWPALLLSAAAFAIEHTYQGSTGMAWAFGGGLAFGVVYLWRKSLIAPAVTHLLVDITFLLRASIHAG